MIRKILQVQKWYGYRGLILALKTKFLSRPSITKVRPPNISHPVYVRTKTSDILTYEQVFINTEYEIELKNKPMNIFDCGSNIGLSAVYFAHRYPCARIIAIEPEMSNYLLSIKNFKHYPKILPIHAALWKDNTEINVMDRGLGHWGFQTEVNEKSGSDPAPIIERVQGRSIDAIMAEYHMDYIDILKVDIEGAEKEVFEDASAWINKIGVLIIELHDCLKDGSSRSVRNAVAGFDFESVSGENTYFARKEFIPDPALRQTWIPL